MKVKVHNDGKEKMESYHAYLDDCDGYGATEAEAIKDLQLNIQGKISRLNSIDYSKLEYVDCFGKSIS